MGGQRADIKLAVIQRDPLEIMQRADIDQGIRLGEAEVHHGNQRLPTGDDLGETVGPAQRGDGLAEIGG